MSCLDFVYFTTTARDGVHTVLSHVEFNWLLVTEKIPPRSWATCEYCPDVIWTSYLWNPFGKAFDIGQIYCGKFLDIFLYPPIQVSLSRCYALWVVVAIEVLSKTLIWYVYALFNLTTYYIGIWTIVISVFFHSARKGIEDILKIFLKFCELSRPRLLAAHWQFFAIDINDYKRNSVEVEIVT